EEVVQAIQTSLADNVNPGSPAKKGKKTKPYVIPYCRFTKLIICEDDKVFGMKIPNELITDDIRRAPYYKGYLEIVTKHEQKITAKKEGGKEKMDPKADKLVKNAPAKQANPATAKQPKPKHVKEKSTKHALLPKGRQSPLYSFHSVSEEYDVERAIQISLESFQAQGLAHVGGVAIQEPVAEASRPLPVIEGKGKTIRRIPTTKEASIGPSTLPQDNISKKMIQDTSSPVDSTNVLEKCVDSERTNSGSGTQAGSDPGKTPKYRPPPDDDKIDEDQAGLDPGNNHVALTGSNSEPIHDDFMATIYPKVHESLKLPADEQSHLRGSKLTARVTAFKNKFFDFEQKIQTLDNTTQNLGSMVFTLELRDLPHKINQIVNEVVKEAVRVAFQTPLRDRFREPPEADMKEILHQRMFESGSYKSLPKYVALEALEASMEQANTDEFLAKKDKSSFQLLKQQFAPQSEQPVEDVPIPDDVNISDSEDTDSAHLPKIKTRPNWLKPVPKEDRLNIQVLPKYHSVDGNPARANIKEALGRFNTIITSLKALDEGYSCKNYVRKFLRALHPKWRAKVAAIKESNDLTSVLLDQLIGNLKVYEMIIMKDSEIVIAKGEMRSLVLRLRRNLVMKNV
nr:zf-CCHC domain-containing protein/UBN2 domain-containing protein [Tanacetum cinerariifolium]